MNAGRAEIRILIADNHSLFREGLRSLLEMQPGFRVVGESGDGKEVLPLVGQLQPDILLLDLRMRNAGGIDILRSLPPSAGKPRVIVLAADIDKKQVSEAFRVGARGVILKEAGVASFFQCINAVAAGQYWVIREASANLPKLEEARDDLEKKERPDNFALTKRELEVVAAVVSGKSNREIAEQFSISVQTVKHHLTSIFDKLGVYNRLELSLFVIHHRSLMKQGSNGS